MLSAGSLSVPGCTGAQQVDCFIILQPHSTDGGRDWCQAGADNDVLVLKHKLCPCKACKVRVSTVSVLALRMQLFHKRKSIQIQHIHMHNTFALLIHRPVCLNILLIVRLIIDQMT